MKKTWLFSGVTALLAIPAGLHALSRRADYQLFGELVARVETEERVVALTFDDGPDPRNTERLLDVLDAHDAKATFFMVGRQVEKYPSLARMVAERGHEVGNHSWSHHRMVFIAPSTARDEIERTDEALAAAGIEGPFSFRAPFGKKLFVLPWVLSEMGRTNILFDVIPQPGDYLRPPADELAADVVRQTRPGSIVVLHDGGGPRDETIEATGAIIEALRADGYRFVTVRELLQY